MDLNFNNSNKKRKVQTVQDMLAAPAPGQQAAAPVMQQSLRESAQSQPIRRQPAADRGQNIQGQQAVRQGMGQQTAPGQQPVRQGAGQQPMRQNVGQQAAPGQQPMRQGAGQQPVRQGMGQQAAPGRQGMGRQAASGQQPMRQNVGQQTATGQQSGHQGFGQQPSQNQQPVRFNVGQQPSQNRQTTSLNAGQQIPQGKQAVRTNTVGQNRPQQSMAGERTVGIDLKEPVNLVYFGILLACLVSSIIINTVFGGGGSGSLFSGKMEKKLYATRDAINAMPTVMGLIPELLDNYVTGGGSSTESAASDETDEAVADSQTVNQEISDDGTITTTNEPDAGGTVTQAGAAMVLDGGQGLSGYNEAASHTELVTQIESALASNDYTFVGMKLAYKDDYGELKGYPQSVVSHFTEYMSQNSDKRTAFITQIADDSYSAMNNSVYLVVLPVIQFTVNMAYDNTTVSVPGFGDTVVNSGQSAVIKPLLPCMYSVTLSNDMWSAPVTKEIATSLDELSYSLSVS